MAISRIRNFPSRTSDPVAYGLGVSNALSDINPAIDGMNQAGVEMDAKLASANQALANANTAATNAANSANTAQSLANSASAVVGAAPWVSGVNYSALACAVSQIDGLTYRTLTAGISTINPKTDTSRWVPLSGMAGTQTIQISERQAQGVGPGLVNVAAQGLAFFQRNINTVNYSNLLGSSFVVGSLTLPAGTYDVAASATQSGNVAGYLQVWNSSDNVELLRGINSLTNHRTECIGRFFLTGPKVIHLRSAIYSNTTGSLGLLGLTSGTTGVEVFSTMQIWRMA